jgi:hypothetical protein
MTEEKGGTKWDRSNLIVFLDFCTYLQTKRRGKVWGEKNSNY